MATNCTHLDQIHDVQPSAQGCEDCLRTGDTWVHLRECLVCGQWVAVTHPRRFPDATPRVPGLHLT